MTRFWVSLVLCIFFFLIFLLLSKRTSPYILGLFCIGLLKIAAGVLVSVFNIYDWHIFPGLIMLMAAVLMQMFFFEKRAGLNPINIRTAALLLLLAVSSAMFLTTDLRFAWREMRATAPRLAQIKPYRAELEMLKTFIDRDRIAAIPPMSAVEWAGYRYTFYPRGVNTSPAGIADIIVYPKNIPEKFTGGFERDLPLEETQDEFSILHESSHFILLERVHLAAEHAESRKTFFDMIDLAENISK